VTGRLAEGIPAAVFQAPADDDLLIPNCRKDAVTVCSIRVAISSLVGCGRGLSAHVPAQRAGAQRLRALALSCRLGRCSKVCSYLGYSGPTQSTGQALARKATLVDWLCRVIKGTDRDVMCIK